MAAAEDLTRPRSALQIKKIDQYCLQGYLPILRLNKPPQANTQSQGLMKDFQQEQLLVSNSSI